MVAIQWVRGVGLNVRRPLNGGGGATFGTPALERGKQDGRHILEERDRERHDGDHTQEVTEIQVVPLTERDKMAALY